MIMVITSLHESLLAIGWGQTIPAAGAGPSVPLPVTVLHAAMLPCWHHDAGMKCPHKIQQLRGGG